VSRIILFTFLSALLLVKPAILAGQDKLPPPPPEEEEPEHRHKLQPAWKSVEIGDYYVIKKAYRAALSRYQDAVQVDPYYPRTYLGMGRVYDRLGLRQKALENYKKYLDLLPSAKDAEEAHEVHKAIARLERQLKTTPAPPGITPQ
jgi:tetratricopeptide (TPR) repeat protein